MVNLDGNTQYAVSTYFDDGADDSRARPRCTEKAGEAAGKALNAARPGLLAASRRAGEMTRKLSENMKKK